GPTRPRTRRASWSGDQLRPRARRLATRLVRPRERSVDVGDEQRVAAPRVRRELGVILATEEPRMIGELDHLAQVPRERALGPGTDDQSGGLESRQIVIVDLVAVAVPLG